jgi:Na+/H+ antiporter NhaB
MAQNLLKFKQRQQRNLMLLAVIILVAAGIYVVVNGKIQASSSLVIQGRPAVQIGIAFILGGALAALLPMLLGALGLFRDFLVGFVLSIAIMFASLVYVAVVIVREKRRQAETATTPTVEDRSKV